MSSEQYIENKRRLRFKLTRFGLLFILILAPLLAAALNYNNNPVCLMVFMLMGLFFVSFVKGGINMLHLHLRQLDVPNTFAKNRAVLSGSVSSLRRLKSIFLDVAVIVNGRPSRTSVQDTDTNPDFEIMLPFLPRGVHNISKVILSSSYPMGLFQWSLSLNIQDCSAWIYPAPRDYGEKGLSKGRVTPGDDYGDFDQLTKWQQGEPLSGLCWKTLARTDRQMKKTFFSTRAPSETVFNWQQLTSLKREDKLSQLCFWVVSAHKQGRLFGLSLPHQHIEPGTGSQHYHRCLMSLASFNPGLSHAV